MKTMWLPNWLIGYRYTGWRKLIDIIEINFPNSQEKRSANRILFDLAQGISHCGHKRILSYYGILRVIEKAKNFEELKQFCSVLLKFAREFQDDAWVSACATGRIEFCVYDAIKVIAIRGDFTVSYNYTPPKPYTYKVIETVEYGGSGCNAYYSEDIEVEKIDYTREKLEVIIS